MSSAKRVTGSTLAAFNWLAQAPHSERVKQWLQCFEACYQNENNARGVEATYSIFAEEDPCVEMFLALVAAGCALRQPKGVMFIPLVWCLRCNRKMAIFLQKHLLTILNFAWSRTQFLQALKAARKENAGVMNSMTKLENLSHDDGVHQLADLYGAMRSSGEAYGVVYVSVHGTLLCHKNPFIK